MATMNLDELVAIDVHTHAEVSTRMVADDADREALEARGRYFRYKVQHPTIAQMAAYYRARKMAFVVFTVDHERGMGIQRISNEEVAESAAEHADVAIPFASIDPARGRMGVREARRLIKDFGVRGFKFHPNVQAFFPNDRDCYPLYEVIAEAGLVALFHSGQTGIGAGMQGGGGLRLKYSNPIYLDDVAADFPTLKIVSAHPERLHRFVRLVAQVFRAEARAVRELSVERQSLVRQRQPGDRSRALACRVRQAADQARGAAADPQGERGEAARAQVTSPRGTLG